MKLMNENTTNPVSCNRWKLKMYACATALLFAAGVTSAVLGSTASGPPQR